MAEAAGPGHPDRHPDLVLGEGVRAHRWDPAGDGVLHRLTAGDALVSPDTLDLDRTAHRVGEHYVPRRAIVHEDGRDEGDRPSDLDAEARDVAVLLGECA